MNKFFASFQRPMWLLCCVLGMLCLASSIAAQQNETENQNPENTHSVTFTRLVFRPIGQFDIRLANENFRVMFLEELRRQNYNAMGAESIVFNQDENYKARMLLGGTINEIDCDEVTPNAMATCTTGIKWEIMDNLTGDVIYTQTTKYSERLSLLDDDISQSMHILALGAFRKLLNDDKCRGVFMNEPPPTTDTVYKPAVFASCNIWPGALPKHIDTALKATVIVQFGNISGSGFLVSRHGLILTAAHVVEGAKKVTVVLHTGQTVEAKILRVNKTRDVALLYTSMQHNACLPLQAKLPNIGQEVFVMGAPAAPGLAGISLQSSVAKGVVSSIREKQENQFIQTDASINPGNSGGPLVDSSGRAIGLISWKIPIIAEGLGFGVPIQVALEKLSLIPGEKTDFETLANKETTETAPPQKVEVKK